MSGSQESPPGSKCADMPALLLPLLLLPPPPLLLLLLLCRLTV
jgi:hypothetical protein